MLNEKKALRKELLALRNASPEKELSLSQLEEFAEFKNAKTIFCYVSAGSEVKTHSLIEKMLKEKRVVVPYCTDKEGNIIAVEIKSLEDYAGKAYVGIDCGSTTTKLAVIGENNELLYTCLCRVIFQM